MSALSYALIALAGFLVGGIPTAYVVGRLQGVDLRRLGSGNVGGTNAVRVLGWKLGVAVMAADVGKGYLAANLLPRLSLWEGDLVYLGLCGGVGAVLGHVFSPYLRFSGGKGVAAGAGVLLALAPLPTAIAGGVFLVLALGTGFVSVGSLAASVALPVAAFLLDRLGGHPVFPAVQGLTVGLALLVFYTHRMNIRRLMAGKENRFRRLWGRGGVRKG